MNKIRVATVTATVGLVLFMTAGVASASPGSPDPWWYAVSPDPGVRYWFGSFLYGIDNVLRFFGINL